MRAAPLPCTTILDNRLHDLHPDIFSHLDPEELAKAALVCKLFDAFANSDATWLGVAKRFSITLPEKKQGVNYKTIVLLCLTSTPLLSINRTNLLLIKIFPNLERKDNVLVQTQLIYASIIPLEVTFQNCLDHKDAAAITALIQTNLLPDFTHPFSFVPGEQKKDIQVAYALAPILDRLPCSLLSEVVRFLPISELTKAVNNQALRGSLEYLKYSTPQQKKGYLETFPINLFLLPQLLTRLKKINALLENKENLQPHANQLKQLLPNIEQEFTYRKNTVQNLIGEMLFLYSNTNIFSQAQSKVETIQLAYREIEAELVQIKVKIKNL